MQAQVKSQNIAVFGGAHIDRRGRISGATAPGASNLGAWFEEAGAAASMPREISRASAIA